MGTLRTLGVINTLADSIFRTIELLTCCNYAYFKEIPVLHAVNLTKYNYVSTCLMLFTSNNFLFAFSGTANLPLVRLIRKPSRKMVPKHSSPH